MVALLLISAMFLTMLHGEVEYQEDNTSGIYYLMECDCEVFNPLTGERLDDDNESKCELFIYKNGSAVRIPTPKELEKFNKNNE